MGLNRIMKRRKTAEDRRIRKEIRLHGGRKAIARATRRKALALPIRWFEGEPNWGTCGECQAEGELLDGKGHAHGEPFEAKGVCRKCAEELNRLALEQPEPVKAESKKCRRGRARGVLMAAAVLGTVPPRDGKQAASPETLAGEGGEIGGETLRKAALAAAQRQRPGRVVVDGNTRAARVLPDPERSR